MYQYSPQYTVIAYIMSRYTLKSCLDCLKSKSKSHNRNRNHKIYYYIPSLNNKKLRQFRMLSVYKHKEETKALFDFLYLLLQVMKLQSRNLSVHLKYVIEEFRNVYHGQWRKRKTPSTSIKKAECKDDRKLLKPNTHR